MIRFGEVNDRLFSNHCCQTKRFRGFHVATLDLDADAAAFDALKG